MEKPTKSKKNMLLKLLPKASIFQNPPFSPGRDKKICHHKGFSGSLIPAEARTRKSNNEETTQEPTSPKVSCIGQIKKKKKNKCNKLIKSNPIPSSTSNFRNIFTGKSKSKERKPEEIKKSAPSLNQMRKFASGREGTLSNFDWKSVQITPEDHRKYYSDDDKQGFSDEEEEVIIPFSAPILVGRDTPKPNFPLEPKKEINLWKRRTMTKPNRLHLNN